MTTFNEGQKKIIDKLKKFIVDKSFNVFILNGYAGTGKTFLMQQLTSYLVKQKIPFQLLATTGRAASILKGKTKHETRTVHGSIYSFDKLEGADEIEEEKHHGQLFLDFKLVTASDNTKEIIIVDEASLISNVKNIQDQPTKFGSGYLLDDFLAVYKNQKIIFVGDPAQLPPVGEEESQSLNKNILENKGRLVIKEALTEIMRTDNTNDILKTAEKIRAYLGGEENNPYKNEISTKSIWPKIYARNRKNISILSNFEALLNLYYQAYIKKPKGNIAITDSNKSVFEMNVIFRKLLYRNQDHNLQVGDILLVTQNNYIIPASNGDFCEVISILSTHLYMGLAFANVRLRLLPSEIEYETILSMDSLNALGGNLTHDQQQILHKAYVMTAKNNEIKVNGSAFKEGMFKDPYLNSLRCSYGYFVTCHKAQGGEWDNVFIFTKKGMLPIPKHLSKIRWWYTAITRAKKHVYLSDGFWLA